MAQGASWVDVIESTVDGDGRDPQSHLTIHSTRMLAAAEAIIVQGTTYYDCRKFEIKLTSAKLDEQFHRIEWSCGNGVGLVKAVQINHDGSSETMEFQPELSTSCGDVGGNDCWSDWEDYFQGTDGPV